MDKLQQDGSNGLLAKLSDDDRTYLLGVYFIPYWTSCS